MKKRTGYKKVWPRLGPRPEIEPGPVEIVKPRDSGATPDPPPPAPTQKIHPWNVRGLLRSHRSTR